MESNAYTLHLAVAALVGASFAAASAYYMHRKTLDQLLRFARSLDRDQRRRARLPPDGEDSDCDLTDGEDDRAPPARDYDRRTLPIPPGLPPLHTGREGMYICPAFLIPKPRSNRCDQRGALASHRSSIDYPQAWYRSCDLVQYSSVVVANLSDTRKGGVGFGRLNQSHGGSVLTISYECAILFGFGK
jgi:hypothetical protein